MHTLACPSVEQVMLTELHKNVGILVSHAVKLIPNTRLLPWGRGLPVWRGSHGAGKVKCLVSVGLSACRGNTALTLAAANGHTDCLAELLEAAADKARRPFRGCPGKAAEVWVFSRGCHVNATC